MNSDWPMSRLRWPFMFRAVEGANAPPKKRQDRRRINIEGTVPETACIFKHPLRCIRYCKD